MAGSGRRVFSPGEVLTASNTMNYLMDQTVMNFAGTAARGSAIGTAVSEGMVSYLADSNTVEVYDGSAWNSLSLVQSPNYVINGAMEVNQRSFSSTTSSQAFTFDRWIADYSGGTTTYSSQTFTPGAAPVAGYEGTTYIRLASTSQTSGGYTALVQKIEDVRSTAGKTVTVSFWAKASTGTPNIGVSLDQGFGSGGSSAVINAGAVKTLTSSWVRYTWTIAMPSVSGKTIGTSSVNQLYIFTSVGSSVSALGYPAVGVQNVTIDIWGVQVEQGSVATPFRRNANSIQGELAACQRYYYRINTNNNALTIATYFTSTVAYMTIPFPVQMRIAPSSIGVSSQTFILLYSASVGRSTTAITFSNSSVNFCEISLTTSASTAGFSGTTSAPINNWIDFTAEL